MTKERIRMIIILAIGLVLYGIYVSSSTVYTALVWEKTEGTVMDSVLYNFKCGKRSQCYALNVAFHVDKKLYTVESHKKYYDSRPNHMNGNKLEVLYSSADPNEARLTGEYGPGSHGPLFFLLGIVLLIGAIYGNKRIA